MAVRPIPILPAGPPDHLPVHSRLPQVHALLGRPLLVSFLPPRLMPRILMRRPLS